MQTLKNCNFILNNLREEDLQELQCLWGSDWKNKVLKTLKLNEVLFAFGQDEFGDAVPIAMGGFSDMTDNTHKVACVWLLSTKYVSKNKVCFMKELKKQFYKNEVKYDLLYNYIHISNTEAKRWLFKLGFSFDNPKPPQLKVNKDFEFFYKLRKVK